jgi:hypothetical protein
MVCFFLIPLVARSCEPTKCAKESKLRWALQTEPPWKRSGQSEQPAKSTFVTFLKNPLCFCITLHKNRQSFRRDAGV